MINEALIVKEIIKKGIINDIEVEQFGDVIVHYDKLLNYKYSFNTKTGLSIRTGIFVDGKETTEDVFSARFPHLIDVGIMGHCSHGKSGLCLKSGVQCYQDGLNIHEKNMDFSDFKRIAEECKGLANQFALGGRGDPNEHENFIEILYECQKNYIIPNYTTSGFTLSDKQIDASAKYCGAVAVSWYRSHYTEQAINRLIEAGVKTNIHYVINKDTIEEAVYRLENDLFPNGINAVIFLTHKPIGLGQKEKCIYPSNPLLKKLMLLIKNKHFPFKIGVDGCFVIGMINSGLDFNMQCLDVCGAARFTCYIDSNMNMSPCSFNKNEKHTINLKQTSIWDAWNGETFEHIRTLRKQSCPNCANRNLCYGGCFLYPEITLCSHINKY